MNFPALAPYAYAFGLVLFRIMGLVMTAPVLSARMVPAKARMALSLVVAFVAFSGAGMPTAALPESPLTLAGRVLVETAIGVAAGLSARMMLDAAQTAGQLAGTAMGLGFGALIDPVNGAESTVMGQLFSTMTLAAAVALGVHREALAWAASSIRDLPPGAEVELQTIFASCVRSAVSSVGLAVQLAFPLLVAATSAHVVFGIAGRTAPQLNLSTIGFSVSILAGMSALYLVVPGASQIAAEAAFRALRGH